MYDDETKYTIKEIIDFCHECPIEIIDREKTRQFLYKCGKTQDEIKDEIRSLREKHACSEPELDYNPNHKGYVYQFKKVVFGMYWCYIKIKMKINNGKLVAILSFHEEEYKAYEKH